jgi:hypothetical protein
MRDACPAFPWRASNRGRRCLPNSWGASVSAGGGEQFPYTVDVRSGSGAGTCGVPGPGTAADRRGPVVRLTRTCERLAVHSSRTADSGQRTSPRRVARGTTAADRPVTAAGPAGCFATGGAVPAVPRTRGRRPPADGRRPRRDRGRRAAARSRRRRARRRRPRERPGAAALPSGRRDRSCPRAAATTVSRSSERGWARVRAGGGVGCHSGPPVGFDHRSGAAGDRGGVAGACWLPDSRM